MNDKKIEDGGPAFPGGLRDPNFADDNQEPTQQGLSLRDWFAGQALAGYMGNELNDYDFMCADGARNMADVIYNVANAMIAAQGGAK